MFKQLILSTVVLQKQPLATTCMLRLPKAKAIISPPYRVTPCNKPQQHASSTSIITCSERESECFARTSLSLGGTHCFGRSLAIKVILISYFFILIWIHVETVYMRLSKGLIRQTVYIQLLGAFSMPIYVNMENYIKYLRFLTASKTAKLEFLGIVNWFTKHRRWP